MQTEVITILTVMALYTAIVVSPGPAFAVATRAALFSSREYALGVPFGLALAAAFYAVLAMMGLHVFISSVGWLTQAVQVLGGLYLVYLGWMLWRSAQKLKESPHDGRRRDESFLQGVVSGALVNFANPKAVIFFVSLYAVAIPAGTPIWVKLAVLGLSFVVEAGWYLIVVRCLSANRSRQVFRKFSAIAERIMGACLMFLGGHLLIQVR